MEINIEKLGDSIPLTALKKTNKIIVREVDEINPLEFVAYVDAGDETFDVSVTISKTGIIQATNCDCKNHKTICIHKIALMQFIATRKKTKSQVKIKNKVDKIRGLLDSISQLDLKEWVADLLQKNEDLKLAFTHRFSSKNKEYTTTEVQKITNDAVKAVVKSKKNVDVTQIKQMISLWKVVHKPILDNYKSDVQNKIYFDCFYEVIESCVRTSKSFNLNTVKFSNYIDEILSETTEFIDQILVEESWLLALEFLINKIPNNTSGINFFTLKHLNNLIGVSNQKRKDILIGKLIKQYENIFKQSLNGADEYTEYMFTIIEENGKFNQYYHIFNPIKWNNSYNLKLIEKLVENKDYERSESFCIQQINSNYKIEHSLSYLLILKKIYLEQKQEKKLAEILSILVPLTYDYEDYVFVMSKIKNEEDLKKYRSKILGQAKNSIRNYNRKAAEFYFKISAAEKKYKQLIEMINEYIPLKLIFLYFDPMALTNKDSLLKQLLFRPESRGWGNNTGYYLEDKTIQDDLLKLILKYYSKEQLALIVKPKSRFDNYYFRSNDFFTFLQEKLQE